LLFRNKDLNNIKNKILDICYNTEYKDFTFYKKEY